MKRTYSLSLSLSHSHRHAVILLYTSHSWVNCKFPSSFCINYLCTSFYGCAKCRDSPSPIPPLPTRLRVATDRNSSCSGTKEVKGGGGGHTIFDEFCTHIWNMLVHFYGKRKRQQLLSRIDGWLPRARRVNPPFPPPTSLFSYFTLDPPPAQLLA